MTTVRNGGFELPALPSGPGVQTFVAGEKFTGWRVKSGQVDIVSDARITAGGGHQFLDLNGTSAGTVLTKVDTVIGQSYTVSFLFAGNPENPDVTLHALTARVGRESHVFVADTTVATTLDPGWQVGSFTFTATKVKTKLFFTGDPTNGATGPILDDVTVQDVAPALIPADWVL